MPRSSHSRHKLDQPQNMKIFLLTLAFCVATHGSPIYALKRNVLPGDPRFGTDFHRHHHLHSSNSDVNQFSQYLPPSFQLGKTEENKQNLELPSTSYGVPFKPEVQVASQAQITNNQYLAPVDHNSPSTSYGTPVFNHVEPVSQLQQVEHQLIQPAPVPHNTYGVPVQHQQRQFHPTEHETHFARNPLFATHIQHLAQRFRHPTSFYDAPMPQQQQFHHVQPLPQLTSLQFQANQEEEHQQVQQIQQVHQVHQTAPIYGAPVPQQHQPVQNLHHFAPVHAQTIQHQQQFEHLQPVSHQVQQVTSQEYGAPVHNPQPQVEQVQSAPVNTDRLIFETPIQSVEVSQSHLVENTPTSSASASVNVDTDAVSVTAVGTKEAAFEGYKYTQPTSSNGGYVY